MWGQRGIVNEDAWVVTYDKTNRPYYFNRMTGQTSWEDPVHKREGNSKEPFFSTVITETHDDSMYIPYFYDKSHLQEKHETSNVVGIGTKIKKKKKKIVNNKKKGKVKKVWGERKIRRGSVSYLV